MPTGTYNLIEQPCVPVCWKPALPAPAAGGFPDRVGLRELLLRSHDIESLAVADAPAHAALLRVLYALTARVAGLTAQGPEGDWDERRLDILDAGRLPPSEVDAYFRTFEDRFFMFAPGGRPWMQDPRLADECDPTNTAGVNKLIVTRPSGNNHAWFQHSSDTAAEAPTVPEAFLSLLMWHYYGPSGRCSSREVNGVKSATATAGPLRTALSYHPEGTSLFETLLAGLVPPEDSVHGEEDLCPWEEDTLSDPDRPPQTSRGPRSRHTGRSQHALLLVPDENSTHVRDAYITWAYRGNRMPREDDYLIWQVSQQGNRYPRPADASRSLWRDLDALLLQHPPAGTAQPQQPRVFRSAAEVSENLRVRALGFDQEGQAKDTQFIDASTPAVLGYAEDNDARTVPAVGRLRQLGELYGRRLDRAVKRAWAAYTREAKTDGVSWAVEAGARYWPRAEAEFWARFRLLDPTDDVTDGGFDAAAIRRSFLRLAEEAYDAVTQPAMGTVRGAKAVSEARIDLYRTPAKNRATAAGPRAKTKEPTQMTTTPPPASGDTATNRPTISTGSIPHQSGTAHTTRSRAFTSWVEQVCREDAGARSALRSGLRKDLDSVRRMHRLVAPWLPEHASEDVERAHYAIAAMIASQPRSALVAPEHVGPNPSLTRRRRSSLGTAFAVAVTKGSGRERDMRAGTAESRLNLLTRQSITGIHRHLPASVGYLRSLGVEVDWAQLLGDLENWRKNSGRISRTWLQDFYRLRNRDAAQQADNADEEELTADSAAATAST
ncbi:type I-E CRISPR-associated protein Cse1/CasA [Streptomyces niveus]|uniref:type I-E CRISPR-associated protein Cse1/CasA n=1 Tax=Streptomyces niveus TaxID=193462 RepID=UPI003688E996